MHGDIGPEIHDIERLIFTRTQYDRAYTSDGSLMQELPQWFQNKTLLFLGCSIAKDRTMEVLQKVTSKNPGLDHYAILACRPENISQRCIEMGDLGISPIYYPDGRHEAVRIILERLLEDTNYAAYEELKRCTRKVISNAANRFMYNSDYIPFVGREEELAQLREFCQNSEQISWWAIAGPGGIGKSRLIYEFTNAQEADGWKICWLKHSDYEHLISWIPPVDRCIIVADDVQEHLQTVGNWIISVSARPRSEKMRIILLERDGKDLDSARWVELMQSDSPYDDTISSRCYCSDFLNLTPLPDDEIKTIMTDFARASGKPLADSGHAERLLQTLKKIDGELQRPIYALAITDAWCSGKDPAHWDKEQILDTLITRELKFYYGRLRNLSTDKISKETRSELENLLARSCTSPFLPLDQITDNDCPKLRKRADKLEISFLELLRQIGIVHKIKIHTYLKDGESENHTEQANDIEAVILDCPDLVKEFLVLRQAFSKGQLKLLFPEDWDNSPMQLLFIWRILIDYPEKLKENNQFWTTFFAGNPESGVSARIYGELLFATTVQIPKMEKKALDKLEKLHNHFQSNEDITVTYAKGLFNLSSKQELKERTQSVEKLGLLHEEFPTNEELAVAYAKGLVNLSAGQELKECIQSVEKLGLLHEEFLTNEELMVVYAQGLVNLSAEQGLKERTQSVEKLGLLHEEFPTNEELMVVYAKGLVNLSAGQELKERTQSVEKLGLLHEEFPTNEELAVEYTRSLVNLSFAQLGEVDIQKDVKQAEELLMKYCNNTEIQLAYAETLFNLTLKQELETLRQTVVQLRKFLMEHSDVNRGFQMALDTYLSEHPEHKNRYSSLRV